MILGILGAASTSTGIQYWIATSTSSGTKQALNDLEADSTDLYIPYWNSTSGIAYLLKLSQATGSVGWQRQLTSSVNDSRAVGIDSSGNLYLAGSRTGAPHSYLAKYNSSGTIQWQRTYASGEGVMASATDSSGNSYTTHAQFTSPTRFWVLTKYDNAGTLSWQRNFGITSTTQSFAFDVDFDTSNDPYYVGHLNGQNPAIVKYNSTGTLQFQQTVNSTGGARFRGIAFNSNNPHCVGYQGTGGYIVKMTTTPAITWQRKLTPATGSCDFYTADFDSAGNVYVVGDGGNTDAIIAKYDSSGTLQWQRRWTYSGGVYFGGIRIVNDVIYATGFSNVSGVNQLFIAKLPIDGSLTGTYTLNGQSYTYAASSFTGSTPTFSLGAAGGTGGTPTNTDAAGTLTDAAASVTYTTTNIP